MQSALAEIVAFGGLNPASSILVVDQAPLTRDVYRRQVFDELHLGTALPVVIARIARAWPCPLEHMIDYMARRSIARRQATYQQLALRLRRPAGRRRIIFLAVPPGLIEGVKAKLANEDFSDADTIVAIEKPFGPPSCAWRRGHDPSEVLEASHG